MSDDQLVIIACRPIWADPELYPTDVPIPDPHAHSVAQTCSGCGTSVWVGPAQQEAQRGAPARCVVVCFRCGVLAAWGVASQTEVRALTNKVVPARWPYRVNE
jgi:hypothetical protein